MLYMSANFQKRLENKINDLENNNSMDYLLNKFKKLKVMTIDRVNNLKSPYLMRLESYNCYVMRMKNMKVLPFHIDFFKKKYDLFKDYIGSETIFDEFEVFFKETSQKEHGE
ncbi:uncharacterized protein LOC126548857 [Aphis gossypii]|uniref:uncharacterized protein LOC126548857 n=1 Tax=Aphis gossypii TaxID=80765 RepID=UPI0021591518|nr:uncharacterized protein LOC126548857 [Aphis gossypii]